MYSCCAIVHRASFHICLALVWLTYSFTVFAVPTPGMAKGSVILPTSELILDVGNNFLRLVNLSTNESSTIINAPPTISIQCPTIIRRSHSLVYLVNDVSSGSVVYCEPAISSKETLWSGSVISFLSYNDVTRMFAYLRSGSLYIRSMDVPRIEELVVEKNVRGPISWNPSGTELLYCTKDDEISILDLKSSYTEVVEKGGWASFSPDGTAIAYRTGNEIRVFNRNNKTTEILQETDLKFPEQTYHWGQLSWSPDGEWIAYPEGFPNFKNCEATIYLVNVAEGNRIEAYKLQSCPIGPLLWWRYED